MADDKVYTQEVIADTPLPNEAETAQTASTAASSGTTYTTQTIKDTPIKKPVIATETIGQALNTKSKKILLEFQFTESGALQIGKYVNGISGDVRISPNGIVGRDNAGITTFAIDGTTGDVTLKGTLQAGTVIGGEVIVGNNTWVIDGDPDTPRLILYNNGIPELVIGEV